MTAHGTPDGSPPGVYAGLRVLDFTMFLAGPYCTRLLADMGADVIKVEPREGDFLRAAPPLRDGHSAYFGHLNCGKRSLALDLKQAQAIAIVEALLPACDVLVENFRPGVMARLGLGYEAVRALKPDIVYCSVTGFGQTGPSAGRPSFAPIIQAASGFDLLLPRYEPALAGPIRNRNATADYLAATHALAGIGAALYHRARTGAGQHVDVALMDAMHHVMSYEYVDDQFRGQTPPTFKPMRTRDGFLAVAPVSEGNFRGLAATAGHPEWLADPRFASRGERVRNWEALLEAIESWTVTQTSAAAEAALLAAGCPAAAFRTIAEARRDPQVAARGAAVTIEDAAGAFDAVNCPIQFSGARARATPWVAALGAHAGEILAAIGYSGADVARLREQGVLAGGEAAEPPPVRHAVRSRDTP